MITELNPRPADTVSYSACCQHGSGYSILFGGRTMEAEDFKETVRLISLSGLVTYFSVRGCRVNGFAAF